MFDAICSNFIWNFAILSDRIVVLSFGLFFATFLMYFSAWRFAAQPHLIEK